MMDLIQRVAFRVGKIDPARQQVAPRFLGGGVEETVVQRQPISDSKKFGWLRKEGPQTLARRLTPEFFW